MAHLFSLANGPVFFLSQNCPSNCSRKNGIFWPFYNNFKSSGHSQGKNGPFERNIINWPFCRFTCKMFYFEGTFVLQNSIETKSKSVGLKIKKRAKFKHGPS